jgi:hypothetical protein
MENIMNHRNWMHRIQISEDNYTPGFNHGYWGELKLPKNLSGKDMLVVGAKDGLHAFRAKRRGADRVMAIDLWPKHKLETENGQVSFDKMDSIKLAKKHTGLDVNIERMNLLDISPEKIGTFDIVLCKSVLKELPTNNWREPIKSMASVTEEKLIIKDNFYPKIINLKTLDTLTNRRTLSKMESWMLNAGCRDIDMYETDPPIWQTENQINFNIKTNDEIKMYKNHDLTGKEHTIKSDKKINIIDETNQAWRVNIKHTSDKIEEFKETDMSTTFQGWVSKKSNYTNDFNSSTKSPNSDSTITKLYNSLQQRGIIGTFNESLSYVIAPTKQSRLYVGTM